MSKEAEEEEAYFEEKATDEALSDLCCYEVQDNSESILPGYNSTTVIIDLTKDATLQWENERKRIDSLIQKNLSIVFDLKIDFSNEPCQKQALQFAIEHFIKTLWIEYYDHAKGILACKRQMFSDTNERDDFLEHVESLFTHVAFHIPIFLLLDCSQQKDLQKFVELSSKDAFDRFLLALKNPPLLTGRVVWQEGSDVLGYIGRDMANKKLLQREIQTAILFSHDGHCDLLPTIRGLDVPFRIIAEKHLTLDWQGIDDLYVCSEHLSNQTKRELEGFKAAGGRILFINNRM